MCDPCYSPIAPVCDQGFCPEPCNPCYAPACDLGSCGPFPQPFDIPCSPSVAPCSPCSPCEATCSPSCCACGLCDPSGPKPCGLPAKRCYNKEFKHVKPVMCCSCSKKNGLQQDCPVGECNPRQCASTMPQRGCPPIKPVPPIFRMRY